LPPDNPKTCFSMMNCPYLTVSEHA
jgi:hypothetical protein